jgi:hypothetical protein
MRERERREGIVNDGVGERVFGWVKVRGAMESMKDVEDDGATWVVF